MRLDPDCMRDILIGIEDHTSYKVGVRYPSDALSPLLEKYDDMKIRYHICQAYKSNLIELSGPDTYENMKIDDLTPAGHQFLANIRDDNVWNGVKAIAGKVGSTSLEAFTRIASNVITQLINAHFGITS